MVCSNVFKAKRALVKSILTVAAVYNVVLIRRVIKSKASQTVAVKHARSIVRTCKEVVKRKGGPTPY